VNDLVLNWPEDVVIGDNNWFPYCSHLMFYRVWHGIGGLKWTVDGLCLELVLLNWWIEMNHQHSISS
jgi:hypothetical protein